MELSEAFGWIAVALTLLAYAQRTMTPLRVTAAAANGFFIVWSVYLGIYPTFILNSILLPINMYRLYDIFIMKRRAANAIRTGEFSLDWIRPIVKTSKFTEGSYIFRKGDAPDKLYYLISGAVVFDEIGKGAGPGELFGELAFFIRRRKRTASARCVGDCEILVMDEVDFTRLFLQDPAFNMHVVRVIAERLAGDLPGASRLPLAGAPA
ncbi:MAG TPA: cyclic nucleotide-binding domain-containing protein [Paracoccaceae bacterium]|nr:cyclic nucleotide-binding domain-containing protein [Paracoccaceae bacterium]